MTRSDETFIVRIRRHEGDAVVEQPRLSRRLRIDEVSEIGPLIERWLEPSPGRRPDGAPQKEA